MIGNVKYLIGFILVFFSCNKGEQIPNVPIISHAGEGIFNPARIFHENSLEALNYALQFEELYGVEMDIQMSKDGTIWLFHDEFLEESTFGKGAICSLSDNELEGIRYQTLNRERLLKLEEINFENFKHEKQIYLDIKLFNSCVNNEEYLDLFLTELAGFGQKLPLNFTLNFIVNNLEFAQTMHNHGFKNLFSDASSFESAKERMALSFYEGFFLRHTAISAKELKILQEDNVKVIIFGMRSVSSIRKSLQKEPYALMPEDFKTALIEIK